LPNPGVFGARSREKNARAFFPFRQKPENTGYTTASKPESFASRNPDEWGNNKAFKKARLIYTNER
jgi:hypothetical protein